MYEGSSIAPAVIQGPPAPVMHAAPQQPVNEGAAPVVVPDGQGGCWYWVPDDEDEGEAQDVDYAAPLQAVEHAPPLQAVDYAAPQYETRDLGTGAAVAPPGFIMEPIATGMPQALDYATPVSAGLVGAATPYPCPSSVPHPPYPYPPPGGANVLAVH